ncbi:APC family permease [Sciscionella marina]|uniref:APC family permease n=1 Tax=Sciscionella marina TaxID=508770 RepID=UPI000361CC89|nr:APC family permease [Sciscionella marina]
MTETSKGALHSGKLGTGGLVLFVLACVTPMSAIVSIVPLGIFLGNGAGFPGAVIVAGIIMLCFAVGFVAMSRHIADAGAFYAYVARGLGRPAGVAASFFALLAYNASFWSLGAALGYFLRALFRDTGLDLPWLAWTILALLVVAVLGRRSIDLSVKVVGVAVLLEVAAIVVVAVAIVATRGAESFSLASFRPPVLTSGSVGIALMFACNMFIGFEATAIFRQESRDPGRDVPRATYLAVVVIAVFYTIAALILIGSVGGSHVLEAMHGDPGNFVSALTERFVGRPWRIVIQVLVVTSMFAALLGIHNAASRYFYALGGEGLLPRRLARVHPRWNSPATASGFQIAIAVVMIVAFGLAGADPLLTVNTSFVGLSTVALLCLETAVAVAAIVFFYRRGHRGPVLLGCTALGAVGLAAVTVLAVANYSVLSGSGSTVINALPLTLPVIAAGGIGYALVLRRRRPRTYAAIAATEPVEKTDGPIEVVRPDRHDR